mgnify:CR=1 FL=1
MDYESHSSPHKGQKKHRAIRIILRDVILFAIALNVFALFHHVLPRKLHPVDTSRYAIATPAPAQAAQSPS